jgi:glucokinase
MLLAGDVGGTKTSVAIFSPEAGPRAPLAERVVPSAGYPSLEALLGEFLAQTGLPVRYACLGVAGPVVDGRATGTNLPWVMDERSLAAALHLDAVKLINDLEAIAYAVPFLEPADVRTLNAGQPAPHGAKAVIAPGTGLGEAFLIWDGSRYRAQPSEGGHADFAPNSPLQLELLRHLQQRFGHVSNERVCSGKGLPNIYAFLREIHYAAEPQWLAEALATAEDPTPLIVKAALAEPPAPLAKAALDVMVAILGAEAGNLALRVLATGGVYLGGGIPPRILPALEQDLFLQAFWSKGRLSELLQRIPVYVILHPQVALLGAACYALGL